MANSYSLSYVANSLSEILSGIFAEYGEEVMEAANETTVKVANDFAKALAPVTPRSTHDTEHLADTITVTERTEKFAGVKQKTLYVHFKKWQISHLLEFGWTLKNGKRMERTPFVRPLFDRNKEKYFNMYVEAIKNV